MHRKLLLLALVAGSLVGLLSQPAAASITIIPPQPTVQDSVKVKVYSQFPMACWRDLSQDCRDCLSDTLSVTVDVDYCHGRPSCICAAFPYSYQRVCNFGLLPAGTYTVTFTELHSNVYDPISTFTQSVRFVVSNVTPTRTTTWGRLKLLYR